MSHSIHALRARWRTATRAQVLDGGTFRYLCRERGWWVLGVMGYAGPFANPGVEDAAQTALAEQLEQARQRHGDRLAVASGATDAGVLALTYRWCARLGVTAIGITCEAGRRLPIAALDWLVPVGERFGDESALFVDICSAFVVLGGGEQSRREAIGGRAQDKPVTLIRGFGGAADALAEMQLPGATIVERG